MWKYKLSLILVLFVSLCLISGCQQKTPQIIVPFAGDYPILKLRQMWGFCLANFQRNRPFVPPPMIVEMCDCYVDEIRKTHAEKDIESITKKEGKLMGQQLIRACNMTPSSGDVKKMIEIL